MTTCNDYDPKVLTVEQALQQLEHDLQPIIGQEQMLLRNALERILSTDILSPINVPPHDHAAMDGYALRGTDLPHEGTAQFQLVGTSWAGKPYSETVGPFQCARIFTGGVIPPGTDTVIMQEDVTTQAEQVIIGKGHKVGQHVCYQGEDLAAGQVVLHAGKRLMPADIGLLASLGIVEVTVKRQLRAAFFSTGDELCPLGKIPQPGQIYDSNRHTMYSMLARLGVEPIDLGVVPDEPAAIESTLEMGAECHDVIITSGGVSVGEADYVTDILRRIGKIHFWKIAVKPGRPLIFGKIKQAAFFGLPGNPVSAMATFYQIVQPALRRLMGQEKMVPVRVKVPCLSQLRKRPGRMEFQRGILEYNQEGQLVVRSTGKQGSALLSSMSQANCFIVLPMECEGVAAGTEVLVEPFEGII
jgi:molybdopterin molybdotransferase